MLVGKAFYIVTEDTTICINHRFLCGDIIATLVDVSLHRFQASIFEELSVHLQVTNFADFEKSYLGRLPFTGVVGISYSSYILWILSCLLVGM